MPHREFSSRVDARAALNASIHTLYQDTLVPVREIARLAGVSERNIYALVRRLGCRPRGRNTARTGKRLDATSTRRASAACRRAAQHQRKLAAAARADLERHANTRRTQRKREADARTLLLLAKTLRELARVDAGNLARTEARAHAQAEETARTEELHRELARRLANLTRDAHESNARDAEAATDQAPPKAVSARIRLLSD